MKQGTIKTLGAAALGAAIAVTAAGAANAATPVAGADTTGVLKNLPVGDTAKTLSGATKTVSNVKPGSNDVKIRPNTKGNKLLGGLPVVTKNLPQLP
ncbi:hypothetical protein AB0C96_30230 [Streptomyces sp. NPDC048506]|uniref:hypothetical protein n=1 Tax=Streptomyces sp. NPDC048506 TaxID=3155028 RepID=UPI0034158513